MTPGAGGTFTGESLAPGAKSPDHSASIGSNAVADVQSFLPDGHREHSTAQGLVNPPGYRICSSQGTESPGQMAQDRTEGPVIAPG